MVESVAEKLPVPEGVRYARMAGMGLGLALLIVGVVHLVMGGSAALPALFIIYGLISLYPWERLKSNRAFAIAASIQAFITVVLVFGLMFHFLFYTYDMAELGRKPRIPGLQGTIIFLGLMQPPAMIFARRPELLN